MLDRRKYNNAYALLNYNAKELRTYYTDLDQKDKLEEQEDIMKTLKETRMYKTFYGSEEDIERIAGLQIMAHYWYKYKVCYQIDPSFYEALEDSEDTVIEKQAFDKLPFPTFAITLADDFRMWLVDINILNDGLNIFYVDITDVAGMRFKYNLNNLYIPYGESLHKTIDKRLEEEDHNPYYTEKFREVFRKDFKFIINFSMYLSASNAVIKPLRVPKKDRPVSKNGDKLNIKKWEVGYRIVKSPYPITEDNIEPGDGIVERHNSPRPHLRRAHYHHYWIGPGRKTLDLKWIEPVWVNGNEDDMIPTEVK